MYYFPYTKLISKLFFKRKIFFICFIFSLIVPNIIHKFASIYLDHFILIQEKNLQNANYQFSFKNISSTSWTLFPAKTILYPTFITSNQIIPIKKWTAKKLVISYSILHPLSISFKIDGEQLFCTTQLTDCLHIHGDTWSAYLPITNKYSKSSFKLFIPELFFSVNLNNNESIFIKAKKITQIFYWNNTQNSVKIPFASNLSIKTLHLHLNTFHDYKIKKFCANFALTSTTYPNYYSVLIHTIQGKINPLFIKGTGKLYLPSLYQNPTGELVIYLSGIQPFLIRHLSHLNQINHTIQDISYKQLPNHLTFPLSIHKGELFLESFHFSLNKLSSYLKDYQYFHQEHKLQN